MCGKWGWRRVLFRSSPTSATFCPFCPVVDISIFQELAESPSVQPICSEHWNFTSLQLCNVICLGAALVWAKRTKTNNKKKRDQVSGAFVKSLQGLSFYVIFISPLSGLKELSLPTLPPTWVFSCVLGNWSCLIVTPDLIRAGLLVHSSAEYLWELLAKVNCVSTWIFDFNQSGANAVWKESYS